MSQCRRGAPSVPAPIMNSENPAIDSPKMYACQVAMLPKASLRRNSTGIRK
jgi:hypothetical protein